MANSKKEIDKDLMYKKLMPTSFKPARVADSEDPTDSTPVQTDTLPYESKPAVISHPVSRDINLPSLDNQPMVINNQMETVVLEQIDSVIARFHCCKCDRCRKDAVALALNKLPPQYRVLTKGELSPDPDRQTSTQALTAMIQAVMQVRSHPRH